MMGDVGDQQARERRDGHIDHEADRHVVGLEIDAHHGRQLEIDEQQQDVIYGDMALVQHADEGQGAAPGGDHADGEQRQVMEASTSMLPSESATLCMPARIRSILLMSLSPSGPLGQPQYATGASHRRSGNRGRSAVCSPDRLSPARAAPLDLTNPLDILYTYTAKGDP